MRAKPKSHTTPTQKSQASFKKRRPDSLAALRFLWEELHEGEAFTPELEPIITPMLKGAEGGIEAVIEALRAHADPDARAFFVIYDHPQLESAIKYLSFEEIAFVAGIGSLRLSELANTALFLYGQLKTKLLVSSSMHRVMASTIKAATDEQPITAYVDGKGVVEVGRTNGDIKAMEMFHKISGMMPVPKGAQIAILNNNNPSSTPTAALWMDAGARLREIHDMTDQRQLPAPTVDAVPFGGRLDGLHAQTAEIVERD